MRGWAGEQKLALRSPVTTTNRHQKGAQLNIETLYYEDGSFRIPLSDSMRDAVREQLRDNRGAVYARVQAVSLQMGSNSVDARDLLSLLCDLQVPTLAVTDNFGVTHQEWMAMRSADPTSIASCLECRTHLPDDNRGAFLRQLRTLKYLGQFDIGDLMEFSKVCELLCETCARERRYCHEQQLRAERLAHQARKAQLRRMSLAEYLKTPEWGALRNRKLIQAGNRCQVCGKHNLQLDVHHNSYIRFGHEQLSDLVVLCRSCHQHFHGILPEAA